MNRVATLASKLSVWLIVTSVLLLAMIKFFEL